MAKDLIDSGNVNASQKYQKCIRNVYKFEETSQQLISQHSNAGQLTEQISTVENNNVTNKTENSKNQTVNFI